MEQISIRIFFPGFVYIDINLREHPYLQVFCPNKINNTASK